MREEPDSISVSVCCCCVTNHVNTQWLKTTSICAAYDPGVGGLGWAPSWSALPLVSVAASGLTGWVPGCWWRRCSSSGRLSELIPRAAAEFEEKEEIPQDD